MGLRSWLFGKEEKKPEALVLGAELRCPYGMEHSYLFVGAGGLEINGLPQAHVSDCVAGKNIMAFGYCTMGAPCESIVELEGQWENGEPQNTLSNDEEIITTKSTLTCKTFGIAIEAVTSGQDGVEAERMIKEFVFIQEMEEKYPGLLEVLRDPWGSLYMDKDMYKIALQFLEEYVEKNGEVQIQTLYSEASLQTDLVKAALGHLLACCNEGDILNLLYVRGSTRGMYDVPGWQPDLLNEAMIELLRKDCEDTAERISTQPFYKWQEEKRQHISWYADKGVELVYASLILRDIATEQTRPNGQVAKVKEYENEAKTTEEGAGESDLQVDEPQMFLNKALDNQNLENVPARMKETWIEGEYKYTVRVHEGNPIYTNAESIYRVSRQGIITDVNGQGSGVEYLGTDGNWYSESVLKEFYKDGSNNLLYNETASKITHIPIGGNVNE